MVNNTEERKHSFGVKDVVLASPILATVIFASFVIYQNQITSYDERKLLECILIVVGLLALSEIVERYATLAPLVRSVSALEHSSRQMVTGHLADTFLRKRCDFPPFADRIKNAKEVWLLGTSLESLVSYHYGDFVSRLKVGSSLRFLLMDPNSASVKARANGLFSATEERLKKDIQTTLERVGDMRRQWRHSAIVKVTSFVPSFGMVLIDPLEDHGVIIVEIYPYLLTSSERAHFELTRKDVKWYSHFLEQYQTLWNTGAKEIA